MAIQYPYVTAKRMTHCGSYVKLECEMVNFAHCDEEIIITMRLLHRHSDIERSKKNMHTHQTIVPIASGFMKLITK